jgi:hypothetical protein
VVSTAAPAATIQRGHRGPLLRTVHCPGFTKGEAAEEFFAAALVEQLERTNTVRSCFDCCALLGGLGLCWCSQFMLFCRSCLWLLGGAPLLSGGRDLLPGNAARGCLGVRAAGAPAVQC